MTRIKKLPTLSNEDSQRAGLITALLKHEGHYEFIEGATIIDATAGAGTTVPLAHIYYKKWRIIGIGLRVKTAYTAGENPDFEIGKAADKDLFGKVTLTITGADLLAASDVVIQDKLNMLGVSSFTNTVDAETFAAGDPDGQTKWQSGYMDVLAANVSALTSGEGYPFILIEIDRSESN